MPPLKDLTGQKFGHLLVIKRAPNKGKKVAWECLCDCGNTAIVVGASLTREIYKTTTCGCRIGKNIVGEQYGELTIIEDLGIQNGKHKCKCRCSCGALKDIAYTNLVSKNTQTCGNKAAHGIRSHWHDLTGLQFGRLTVVQETDKRIDGRIVWLCQCECGNYTEVISSNLTKDNTLSCGCYHKEVITNDITNQRFGKLVALRPTDKRYGKSIIWECKCDCGNFCEKPTSMLITGGVKSCGCISSMGEEGVEKLLKENRLNFIHHWRQHSCRFNDTGRLAEFDFYIMDSNYIIEFDGIQHFEVRGWNTEERFQYVQEHDAFKNQWCLENNIPLIRIPYWKLDTLCIEDLMLETTKFRVV